MESAPHQKPETLNPKILSLLFNLPAYLLIGYFIAQYFQGVPNETILQNYRHYRDLLYTGYFFVIVGLYSYYFVNKHFQSIPKLKTLESFLNTYISRIVISLLLITFSYAIAGLIIDIVLLLTYLLGL